MLDYQFGVTVLQLHCDVCDGLSALSLDDGCPPSLIDEARAAGWFVEPHEDDCDFSPTVAICPACVACGVDLDNFVDDEFWCDWRDEHPQKWAETHGLES